jgi:hypothetical protein
MSDLGAGRYPFAEEEWLFDGQPYPPYRRSLNRRDLATGSTGVTLSTATLYCIAVPVQAGDIFNYVSFGVVTATASAAHSWVAVYNGVKTGAALLAQSTDVTTGFAAGANKITLNSEIANSPTVGTPQGPSTAAIVASGPTIYGVVLYATAGSTVVDGTYSGGGVAGNVIITGQVPLLTTASLSATATAPAVLPTMSNATKATSIPYVVLSMQ